MGLWFSSGHLHCFWTTKQHRSSNGSFESRSFRQASLRSKERRLAVRHSARGLGTSSALESDQYFAGDRGSGVSCCNFAWEMTTWDKGKLVILSFFYLLSTYSTRLYAPCHTGDYTVKSTGIIIMIKNVFQIQRVLKFSRFVCVLTKVQYDIWF